MRQGVLQGGQCQARSRAAQRGLGADERPRGKQLKCPPRRLAAARFSLLRPKPWLYSCTSAIDLSKKGITMSLYETLRNLLRNAFSKPRTSKVTDFNDHLRKSNIKVHADISNGPRQIAIKDYGDFEGLGKGLVTPQIVRFYDSFDNSISQTTGIVSCKLGCAYCCHYRVTASATEVFGVAEAVRRLPTLTRSLVTDRIYENAALISTMTPKEYEHTNIQCAMLIEGKCSVYAARPLSCRGHHSLDVEVCKKTHENVHSDAEAPRYLERKEISDTYMILQLKANRQAGLDPLMYEMHAALATAIKRPSAFKRWKAGKSAFPRAVDKTTLF